MPRSASAFLEGDGSWSYLGTECRDIPADETTMNYGWLTPDSPDDELQRVVLHEFGHALGLIHEHQNPEGGIDWNVPAVLADLGGPPNNWDEQTARHNVLDHYQPDEVTATTVDAESIMMYADSGRLDQRRVLRRHEHRALREGQGAHPHGVPALAGLTRR